MSEPTTAASRLVGSGDAAARPLWLAVAVADLLALLVLLPVPAALLLAPVLVRFDSVDLGFVTIDTPSEGWLAAVPGLVLVVGLAALARKVVRAQIALASRTVPSRREAAAESAARRTMPELTEREGQVLRLMSQGLTNGAIAKELFISEATVRKHIGRIFAKLDVDQESRDRRVTAVLTYIERPAAHQPPRDSPDA